MSGRAAGASGGPVTDLVLSEPITIDRPGPHRIEPVMVPSSFRPRGGICIDVRASGVELDVPYLMGEPLDPLDRVGLARGEGLAEPPTQVAREQALQAHAALVASVEAENARLEQALRLTRAMLDTSNASERAALLPLPARRALGQLINRAEETRRPIPPPPDFEASQPTLLTAIRVAQNVENVTLRIGRLGGFGREGIHLAGGNHGARIVPLPGHTTVISDCHHAVRVDDNTTTGSTGNPSRNVRIEGLYLRDSLGLRESKQVAMSDVNPGVRLGSSPLRILGGAQVTVDRCHVSGQMFGGLKAQSNDASQPFDVLLTHCKLPSLTPQGYGRLRMVGCQVDRALGTDLFHRGAVRWHAMQVSGNIEFAALWCSFRNVHDGNWLPGHGIQAAQSPLWTPGKPSLAIRECEFVGYTRNVVRDDEREGWAVHPTGEVEMRTPIGEQLHALWSWPGYLSDAARNVYHHCRVPVRSDLGD